MSGGSAAAVLQYTGIGAFVSIVLFGAPHLLRPVHRRGDFVLRRGDADGTEHDAVTARTGLAAADVAVLPTFMYHAASPGRGGGKAKAAVAADCCAVCLDELHEGELVRMLPSCRHYFHASCVDVWLWSHATCPVCRASPICWRKFVWARRPCRRRSRSYGGARRRPREATERETMTRAKELLASRSSSSPVRSPRLSKLFINMGNGISR